MNPFGRGKEVCFCHYRVQTVYAANSVSCLHGMRRSSFPGGSMVTVQSKPLSSPQSPGQQARCFTSTHPSHPFETLTARETLHTLRKSLHNGLKLSKYYKLSKKLMAPTFTQVAKLIGSRGHTLGHT